MLFRANNLSMWPSAYAEVFARLEALQYNGKDRWSAKCPAHEDVKPSLSVALGDGKLLVRCHRKGAQCEFREIVAALGLQTNHFRENRGSTMGKFKEAYDYRDENNRLLFQVCRMEEPKSFYQRRPNPAFDAKKPRSKDTNPEFINNLEGVRRILFNLPGMMAALKQSPKRWVLVMEGEKDCLLANKNGLVATTNPMGALEWKEEYSDFLKGCNVVVIPDNDPIDPQRGFSVGIEHARRVCQSLEGKAAQVVFLELPDVGDKGDFSDWWNHESRKSLDQAAKKAALAALIKSAPQWSDYKKAHNIQSDAAPTPGPATEVVVEPQVDSPGKPEIPSNAAVDNPAPVRQFQSVDFSGQTAIITENPTVDVKAVRGTSENREDCKMDEIVRAVANKIVVNGRVMALGQLAISYDSAYNYLVSSIITPERLRESFAALSAVALRIANEADEICKDLS